MNQRTVQKQKIINDNLRKFFQPGEGKHVNTVRFNTGSTEEHELMKAKVAFNAMREGFTIITEGKLKNGKRPDIVILDLPNPIAYEVMHSEELSNLTNKQNSYKGMRVIPVDSTHLFSSLEDSVNRLESSSEVFIPEQYLIDEKACDHTQEFLALNSHVTIKNNFGGIKR